MAGRIVLFGATGYTGDLVARALVARGEKPLLAGRSAERLGRLGAELGGLDTAVADVDRPASVRALVERGDVLVSTVGPFMRWGGPALEAALDAGAHYLDSTGEPAFIRRVFEREGPRALAAGVGLLTAFGYDWVPGNLAGALALRDAGPSAVRVDIGYFSRGSGGTSGGTQASLAGAAIEPSFTYRAGRLQAERTGARARAFKVGSVPRWALSVGGSEHYALPALHPSLRDVDVLLAAAGPQVTRAMPVLSLALAAASRVPPLRAGLQVVVERRVPTSTGGPDAAARQQSSCVIVAEARADDGTVLKRVHLDGVNGYTFTGDVLAWGAARAAAGDLRGTGALGPVAAFGLENLEDGARQSGLMRRQA